MAFHFKKLKIPEVISIESDVYGDQRGFFTEVHKYLEFKENGIAKPFVQINHSKSTKGVLRSLQYQQDPMAQGKLVTVVEGEIFDVAVDIRPGSPTYGQWVGQRLDSEKKTMLYVPEGFAHGLCVLSDIAQMIYYCTEVHSPEHERGLMWNNPALKIEWPIDSPILSEKDAGFPTLKGAGNYAEKAEAGSRQD